MNDVRAGGAGQAGVAPAAISLQSVTKRFGFVVAVDDVPLDIGSRTDCVR